MMIIEQIYRDMILLESLDSPYKLTDVTSFQPKEIFDRLTDENLHDVKFYSCDDELGHSFITGTRHGSFEVHHQNYQNGAELQGQKNVLGKPPSKFIATAFSLMKPSLDARQQVRIVAPEVHINSYHRIASAVARRHGVSVSTPFKQDDGLHTFLIGEKQGTLWGFPQIKRKP